MPFSLPCKFTFKKVRYIVYSFYASPPFIVHREEGNSKPEKISSLDLPLSEWNKSQKLYSIKLSSRRRWIKHERRELRTFKLGKFVDWLWVKLSKENPLSNLSLERSRAMLKNAPSELRNKTLDCEVLRVFPLASVSVPDVLLTGAIKSIFQSSA